MTTDPLKKSAVWVTVMVRQWLSVTLFVGAAPFESFGYSLWSPAHCLLFHFHYHLPQ